MPLPKHTCHLHIVSPSWKGEWGAAHYLEIQLGAAFEFFTPLVHTSQQVIGIGFAFQHGSSCPPYTTWREKIWCSYSWTSPTIHRWFTAVEQHQEFHFNLGYHLCKEKEASCDTVPKHAHFSLCYGFPFSLVTFVHLLRWRFLVPFNRYTLSFYSLYSFALLVAATRIASSFLFHHSYAFFPSWYALPLGLCAFFCSINTSSALM